MLSRALGCREEGAEVDGDGRTDEVRANEAGSIRTKCGTVLAGVVDCKDRERSVFGVASMGARSESDGGLGGVGYR